MENAGTRPPSGAQWTIAADGHEAVIVEVGGGLRTYRHDGVDYVDGYGLDELCPGCAGQVLAPWPNRIRDGRYSFGGREFQLALTEPERHVALHGLVNYLPWRLESQTADSVVVRCDLPAQSGYPWPLLLRAEWRIGPTGLHVTHQATNVGREECPFGFSVHPYLRLPGVAVDDLLLRVPARSHLLLDNRLLPIGVAKVAGGEYDFTEPRRIGPAAIDMAFGDLELDPAAEEASRVTLSSPDGTAAVSVWADATFGWWQVFTGDTLPGERYRRSVAIEPMTCPPDAFRTGRDVIVLEPGRTFQASWGIRPGR